MSKVTEETGNPYGMLIVIERSENNKYGQACWLCECQCEKKTRLIVPGFSLRQENTTSCGCVRSKLTTQKNIKRTVHGGRSGIGTVEYDAFNAAKGRCQNKNNRSYKDYGGRGIEFRFNNFQDFLAEVGLRPSDEYSLDRSDNDGHYEKGNLSWQTKDKQANNRRSYHETLTRQIAAQSKKIEELQILVDKLQAVSV